MSPSLPSGQIIANAMHPGMYCILATSIVAAVSPNANQKSGMPIFKFNRKIKTIWRAEKKATMMVV